MRETRVDDALAHPGLERPRQLTELDLHTRDSVVVTHAHLAKPELRAQDPLEATDLGEALTCDARSVRDATRQTRGRGLVPDTKAKCQRPFAHVRLRETELDEWAQYAGLRRGFEPRAVVTEVVDVGTIEDVLELPLAPLGHRDAVEFTLAVKAAVGVVRNVRGVIDFARVDQPMIGPHRPGNRAGFLALELGQAR